MTVPVSGSVREGRIDVGEDRIELPLLRSTCAVDSPAVTRDGPGALTQPLRFAIQSPVALGSWLVRVHNPDGTVLIDLDGDGTPQQSIVWPGTNEAGAFGPPQVLEAWPGARNLAAGDFDGNGTLDLLEVPPSDAKSQRFQGDPAIRGLRAGLASPRGLEPLFSP